ncbi:LysM peptidoglycan-binding domain-containing protein [Paenibacillus sp. MWE-103]|uniref:LysM peptidoglycan-binding domain-containing protein n=1 Tax=Paenibacillus artemisiicola TaxID=1172618 RepID=A0ABS3W9Z1_9BACL|nr:3D domain-containing protein [Paenibacillus artemisiicola]MBO7745156.1 LysM peptidoglycan-binding domain-containing protein [Paenibacillus artemisiicola]
MNRHHWKKGIVAAALGLVIFAQSAAAHAEGTYKAQNDDTFWRLSQKFGVSVDLLQQANPFVEAGNIYDGLMLVIPAAEKVKTAGPARVLKQEAKAAIAKKAPAAEAKQSVPKAAKKAPAKKAAATASKATKTAVKKTTVKKTTVKPSVARKPQRDRVTVNGKSYVYSDVKTVKASAYTAAASENGWGPVDYFGNPLKLGTIAVDPEVIPMGTKVYITGYDHGGLPAGGMLAVASDQGSAISGNRIDIFVPQSQKQASEFGFQNVKVFILNK